MKDNSVGFNFMRVLTISHVKWTNYFQLQPFAAVDLQTLVLTSKTTSFRVSCSTLSHLRSTSFGPIRRLNLLSITGYVHLHCLTSCAFPPFCCASDVISNSVNTLNTLNTNLAGQTDKSKYMYQAQTGGAQQACRGRI